MREIKFRAWHKKECYYEYLELQTYNFGSMRGLIDQNIGLEDAEWEQYTGLNDKNGIPIYEGDIVSGHIAHVMDHEGPVVFKDGCFCVDDDMGPYIWCIEDCEIIGNIHEEKGE